MTISINGAGALFTLPKSTLSAVFGSPTRIENLLHQGCNNALAKNNSAVSEQYSKAVPYLNDTNSLLQEIQETTDNLIEVLLHLSDCLVDVIPSILELEGDSTILAKEIGSSFQWIITKCNEFNKYIPPFKQAYSKLLGILNNPILSFLPSTISTDISKETDEISTAVGQMQGVYESLHSDFQAAINAPVNSNCPFLQKLLEEISKIDWITLRQEATALRNSLKNI